MDQAEPSTQILSTLSSSSVSPLEYGQFKGHAQHQIMELQRMYQEPQKPFTTEQNKTQEQEIDLRKEQTQPLKERIVNLQNLKFVGRITDENLSLKNDHKDNATKKPKDETNEEIIMVKAMIETLANTVQGTRLKGGAAAGGSSFVIPPNFAQITTVLEQQVGSYDVKLAETDLRFQVMETTNYNGSLIWKIQDFNRRKKDAKQVGACFINSRYFYTSKYGYKMRLCICLNADGMGEDAHISMYLVIMKGKYDASLPFPLQKKVTLSLLEHGSEERAWTPDASSLMKPISGSGFPTFVSHDRFKQGNYVVDDTILVKAVIEGKVDRV